MYPDRFDKIGTMTRSVKLSVNENVQTPTVPEQTM